ncbi:MAG TPA: transcriptional repressor, partial [Chloroflexi bacterium]|nr:transcriptional repressor [Chloroflexota bacterium]
LATVYRTLALLKEAGLVEEHRLGEDHAHFEAVRETPHYHFTCLECGRVVEFDAPQVMEVVRVLSEREELQVTDVHLFLGGYCARCQEAGGKRQEAGGKKQEARGKRQEAGGKRQEARGKEG